jgi:acyl-CoA thioester hydrolase
MKVCRTLVRVRYPEVDRMGVAHHSHYPVWFEVGRTELMRELGAPYAELESGKLFMPVVEMGVRYLVPIRYDEEIEILTRVEDVTGARVRFGYALTGPETPSLRATGFTVHAAVGDTGRPTRLPPRLRSLLEGGGAGG